MWTYIFFVFFFNAKTFYFTYFEVYSGVYLKYDLIRGYHGQEEYIVGQTRDKTALLLWPSLLSETRHRAHRGCCGTIWGCSCCLRD